MSPDTSGCCYELKYQQKEAIPKGSLFTLKLGFTWDEVHEIAEQLEHIQSTKLIEKLDHFLDYPQYDPHGDAIPNANGEITPRNRIKLFEMDTNQACKIIRIKSATTLFLKSVDDAGLGINSVVTILKRDESLETLDIAVNGNKVTITEQFAKNIYVKPA